MTSIATRGSRLALALAVCAAGAVIAGCEEDSASKSFVGPFAAAWKKAELDVGTLAPMTGAAIAGGTCWSGTVSQLDTVLCRYPNAAAATKAKSAGLTYVGETTGSVLSVGVWLLAVADRENADPKGKALNALTKGFLEAGAGEIAKAKEAKEAAKEDKEGDKRDKQGEGDADEKSDE